MKDQRQSLEERTKQFAIGIIKLVKILPQDRITDIISRQILRAGTSVGANYRAACRARSKADFVSKMGIVEEEVDETLYWLELLIEAKIIDRTQIEYLLSEGNEITAIVVTSINTAKKNQK